jgi:hypothetical protein
MNRTPEQWAMLRAKRSFWRQTKQDVINHYAQAINDLLEHAEEARLYREAWEAREAEEALLKAMLGGKCDPDGKALSAQQAADAAVRKHRGEG